jgi:hypothetical protein
MVILMVQMCLFLGTTAVTNPLVPLGCKNVVLYPMVGIEGTQNTLVPWETFIFE